LAASVVTADAAYFIRPERHLMNRIPTPRTLHNSRRRLDTRNVRCQTVLDQMRLGAVLHLEFRKGCPVWWLSPGENVTPEIASLVVLHRFVRGGNDGLLAGVSQTFIYGSNQCLK
jgi:hypothetical protein